MMHLPSAGSDGFLANGTGQVVNGIAGKKNGAEPIGAGVCRSAQQLKLLGLQLAAGRASAPEVAVTRRASHRLKVLTAATAFTRNSVADLHGA